MKKLILLFALLNSIILQSQNFSSFNNELSSSLSVYSIANSGSSMYIGTNDGVYLSENNSSNWVPVNTDLEGTEVNALALSGSTLYAGTFYGVFSSTNKGQSWNDLTSGLTDPIIVYDLIVNGSNIFAGCDYGLYRSTNNGKNWIR